MDVKISTHETIVIVDYTEKMQRRRKKILSNIDKKGINVFCA